MIEDLFGPVPPAQAKVQARGLKPIVRRGYAAPPGTGPADHTCGDCQHVYRLPRYAKCRLVRQHWTHGQGSDVLSRSPACSKWEPKV